MNLFVLFKKLFCIVNETIYYSIIPKQKKKQQRRRKNKKKRKNKNEMKFLKFYFLICSNQLLSSSNL